MRRWAATFGLAAFCFCSSALAQDAALPPPDPAKVTLAAKILEETHAIDNMTTALELTREPMMQSLKRQSPSITDDQLKLIGDMLLEEMRKELPQAVAINAQIYASHFTLEELNQIEAFYETPAGQKIISETPKIVREARPIGQAWARQAAQEALGRVLEKLRQQGVKI